MFHYGDKIFYHASVHLEAGIGWAHLEIAGIVTGIKGEQVAIVDKFGQSRLVEPCSLTQRPDDDSIWYAIDNQPLRLDLTSINP